MPVENTHQNMLTKFLKDDDWKELQTKASAKSIDEFGLQASEVLCKFLRSNTDTQDDVKASIKSEIRSKQLCHLRKKVCDQFSSDMLEYKARITDEYLTGFKVAYINIMMDDFEASFAKQLELINFQLEQNLTPDLVMPQALLQNKVCSNVRKAVQIVKNEKEANTS